MKHMKKLCALGLTMLMTASTVAPAYAVNSTNGDINVDDNTTKNYVYAAPDAPMEVDDTVVTASAHRAASPLLGILGVNATSGFGMINGGAPANLAEAQACPAMGIWGSSVNSKPDPYYWNYFYNYYAEANGLSSVAQSVYGGTALTNDNVAASPTQADTTLFEKYGNLSVSVASRPEILIGVDAKAGVDYTAQLETIRSFVERDDNGSLIIYKESDLPNGYVLYNADSQSYEYKEGLTYKKIGDDQYIKIVSQYYRDGDETYHPKLVKYATTTIENMIDSVKTAADAIKEVAGEKGKKTRYGDVETIASDYETYVYGIISYVQSQLAEKGMNQKTFAFVTEVNEDGTFTLGGADYNSATSLGRAYEYCIAAATPLVTETTTVTKEELLTADVIITLNNNNITADTMAEAGIDSTSYKGILITDNPASLYGITMNSVENAIGYAYVIGSMYSDVLDIDPVELAAYFYEHFEHVTDIKSLQTVVTTNFSATKLPEGVSADISGYKSSEVEEMLEEGMIYYVANENAFDDDQFLDSGIDEWTPDFTQGIGAGISIDTDTIYFQAATCTSEGAYCVKDTSGNTLVDITLPIKPHVYGKPEFQWDAAGTSATAVFTCVNEQEAAKTVTVKADITSKVTKAATYDAKGETTYTATVSDPVTGKTYTSTKTVANIAAKAKTNLQNASVTVTSSAVYTGSALSPKVTVKIGSTVVSGSAYTITYKNAKGTAVSAPKAAGTYTVTITSKNGNYPITGSVSKTFIVKQKAIGSASLSTVSYTYNGKAKTPSVTVKSGSVKLKKGTDYTVSYSSNTKVGTAVVKIKGKGNYSGTITKYFTINPKATAVSSAKNSKSGAVKLTWKKVSGVTGYQIRYRTGSGSWKKVTVKGAGSVSKTVTKLKKGKTYTFQIRSYQTKNNKNYYSTWSKEKTCKINK